MALLDIYSCFHPILKTSTEKIENIDDEIRRLADDMFETMYHADGAGLAGNQVGLKKSIVVIDTSMVEGKRVVPPTALINPEIISFSDDEIDYSEGCLSVPTLFEPVKRPKSVAVRFYDLRGKEVVIEDDELFARVVQHELDHLSGILFYERLSAMRRVFAKKILNKIKNGDIEPDYSFIRK